MIARSICIGLFAVFLIMTAVHPALAENWTTCDYRERSESARSVMIRLNLNGQSCLTGSTGVQPLRNEIIGHVRLDGILTLSRMSYGVNPYISIISRAATNHPRQLPRSGFERFEEVEILSQRQTPQGIRTHSRVAFEVFHVPFTIETVATVFERQDPYEIEGQTLFKTRQVISDDLVVRMQRGTVDLERIEAENDVHAQLLDLLRRSNGVCNINHSDFFSDCQLLREILQNRSAAQCQNHHAARVAAMQSDTSPRTASEIGLSIIMGVIQARGFSLDYDPNCADYVELAPWVE